MFVVRVDPERHSLVRTLAVALRAFTVAPMVTTHGVWTGRVQATPPEHDRERPAAACKGFLPHPDAILPIGARWQCANYFGPGGGIDWHTDSRFSGWRIYAFRYTAGTGRMLYGPRVFNEADAGAYLFETGMGCWHAVESEGHRFSVGVQIDAQLAAAIRDAATLPGVSSRSAP